MSRALTIAGYVVPLIAIAVIEVIARRAGSRLSTFAGVISAATARRAGRVAVVLAWWWTGWHFFVR